MKSSLDVIQSYRCGTLVVLTDGGDIASNRTLNDNVKQAASLPYVIHTIILMTPGDTIVGMPQPDAISALSTISGGIATKLDSLHGIMALFQSMAQEIIYRNLSCTISYTGTCIDGGERALEVTYNNPSCGIATADTSYRAPDNTGTIVPVRFAPPPLRTHAGAHVRLPVLLPDSTADFPFVPADIEVVYDPSALRLTGAEITRASLLDSASSSAWIIDDTPGTAHLHVEASHIIHRPGGLADLLFDAADVRDTIVTSINIHRMIFDHGCVRAVTSAAPLIIIPCLPVPVVAGSQYPLLCPGDSITLIATGVWHACTWSHDGAIIAADVPSITVRDTGTYVFSVSSVEGCTTMSHPFVVRATPSSVCVFGSRTTQTLHVEQLARIPLTVDPALSAFFPLDIDLLVRYSPGHLMFSHIDTASLGLGGTVSIHADALPPDAIRIRATGTPGTDVTSLGILCFALTPVDAIVRDSLSVNPLAFTSYCRTARAGVIPLRLDGRCERVLLRAMPQPVITTHPNPFTASTVITVELPASGVLHAVIEDALGHEVIRLADAPMEKGPHNLPFHAADLPSGIYIIRARMDDGSSASAIIVRVR